MILSSRFLAIGVLIVSASATFGQVPKPPDWSRVKSDVGRMRNGNPRVRNPDSPAESKKHQESIKIVAQYLAFTIATPPFNGEPVPREDKTPAFVDRSMSALMTEADFYLSLPITTGNQGKITVEQSEYGAEMGAAIVEACKVVLEKSAKPIERVNAVRMMSLAARLPAPALGLPLAQIVANPKISDAEKLYAVQGIRNLIEQTDIIDPTKHVIRDVNVLGQISEAVSAYIVQDRAPRDARDVQVIEFVRRHAVMAIAQFKDGAIRKPSKDLISRPSWTLMRVMASDPAVTPAFSTLEKVEAAIGFCQQRVDPTMNLDVAAFNLAGVDVPGVIVEFTRVANVDVGRASREGTLPSAHWKVLAARLSYALAVWRESCKSLPAARYPQAVTSFANTSIALLAPIEKEGGAAATGPEAAKLVTWSADNRPAVWKLPQPKPAQLYSDDNSSLLPFAAPAKKSPELKTPVDPKLTTPMAPPAKGPDPKVADPKTGAK